MTPDVLNVLCIDDDPDVILVVQLCMESEGRFNVTTANGGKEALKILENTKPSAILLDVMMPEMDGFSTLKALRQNRSLDDVPVIFMTARAISHEMDEYLALGANGALPKPFDPMTLSAQVLELWEKFHAR